MTQFDILLRQGLMDANLEQYGRVLQSADSLEPGFSPRYLRERMRLLAAPQDWEERRARPAGGESPGASPRPLRSSFSSQRLRQSPSLCGSPTSAG